MGRIRPRARREIIPKARRSAGVSGVGCLRLGEKAAYGKKAVVECGAHCTRQGLARDAAARIPNARARRAGARRATFRVAEMNRVFLRACAATPCGIAA